MSRMTYRGPNPGLAGKTALVQPCTVPGHVLAQFDDIDTGLGFGWHRYHAAEFRPVEDA